MTFWSEKSAACGRKILRVESSRECEICGTAFRPLNWQHRFCSPACRNKHHYTAPIPRRATMKACVECGDEFAVTGSQRRCRPCIDKDRAVVEAKRQRECKVCGVSFVATRDRRTYCSPTCKAKAHLSPPLPPRQCQACERPFVPGYPRQIYCSSECRLTVYIPKAKPRTCPTCATEFQPVGNQTYCAPACNPRLAPKPRPRRDLSRACSECGEKWTPSNPRVQTTLCPACRERADLEHVYSTRKAWKVAVRKRAKNRCEDCGHSESEAGAPLHSHHLIPQGKGGEHTLANGRLLCIACHSKAHNGATGGATFAQQIPVNLVDQIAEQISAALSKDLERIESRVAAIEELAQRY